MVCTFSIIASLVCGEFNVVERHAIVSEQNIRLNAGWNIEGTEHGINSVLNGNASHLLSQLVLKSSYITLDLVKLFVHLLFKLIEVILYSLNICVKGGNITLHG